MIQVSPVGYEPTGRTTTVGAIMIRCLYCDALLSAEQNDRPNPAIDDDEAWAEIATEHAADCEWIATRAHRVVAS